MAEVSGKAFDYKLFRRVLAFVKPYRLRFWLTTALTVALAFVAPVKPILIGRAIDSHVKSGDARGLIAITAVIVLVLLLEALLQFFQTYHANWLGQTVTIDLRSKLFKHITKFRLKYFDDTPIGRLVTRTVSDIETIADIFSQGLLIIIGDILKLVVVIVIMFSVSWRLTLLSLLSIPLLLFATYIFKNAIKKAFNEVRTQVSRLNTFVQEHITGMYIVQVFNREKVEMQRFEAMNRMHMQAHIKSVWANSIFFPVVEIFSAISLALLIWWGMGGVLNGMVTFGDLVAFILFIHMLFRPIRQLADRFNVLQMGMAGSERVFGVLDTELVIEDTGNVKDVELKGNIQFENVTFGYKENETVLHGISFEVKAGETIAIVGATGAGKSTIISLLNRFYEFQSGEILLDGRSIRDYELGFLRTSITVVMQDVFLFSDSIMNNITLNNPEISKERVVEAAKVVGAHEFIMKLPGNYHFQVMERGGMLSVGQRQLLAFIRAYVYQPKVLILDEATSSIDTESELLIRSATERVTQNRTSIVIAHRLSTIQSADKILVMDCGKILETGSHNELLGKGGVYKRLFDLQFVQ